MLTYEMIRSRIHPVPRQLTVQDTAALTLSAGTRFTLNCPDGDGPIQTAKQQLLRHLKTHWSEDCFASGGIPISLTLSDAPEGICPEGYRLNITGQGITVTGFGDRGLLYGVLSLCQLLEKDACLPETQVLDWPEKPIRGYRQESRWGSNMMERQDWFALIEDIARKKLNVLNVTLYCCWNVQYDGKVAEYLYFPVKGYPQLQTPFAVKYYSPGEEKWIEEETLPPIFRDDLFGELVAYGKNWGVEVMPTINSLGHNTLLPRLVPEASPKDSQGQPTNTGFCTSSEETYRLLFAMYDQLIDTCLIPNGIRKFCIGMDEVRPEYATDAARPSQAPSPWCECPECQKKTKQDMFVNHAIRLIRHLKEKGMQSVFIHYDMLLDHPKGIGDVAQRFYREIHENSLQDVVCVDWWYYYDTDYRLRFHDLHDEFGLRSIGAPWNGYYNWSLLTNCTRNIKLMADMTYAASQSAGMILYSAWDKSADRLHDCHADYCWNHSGAGELEDILQRYVNRHFAPLAEKVCHAFRLMEQCTQQRLEFKGAEVPPEQRILSHYDILYRLCYYPFSYYSPKQPYPRHFPGEGLGNILPMREDFHRAFYAIGAMAQEAAAIFRETAEAPGCDHPMAKRMVYECENYLCLCRDWQAFVRLHDLQGTHARQEMARIASDRADARLALMTLCEQVKGRHLLRGAAMREHSVFLQTFRDIAAAANDPAAPEPDLMDITPITTPRLRSLR